MAAKTFSLVSNTTTASQITDTVTTGVLFAGEFSGGYAYLEISQNNTIWAPAVILGANETHRPGTQPAYYELRIPAGWRVRATLVNAQSSPVPAVTIVVE